MSGASVFESTRHTPRSKKGAKRAREAGALAMVTLSAAPLTGACHLAHVPSGFVIWPTCRWASSFGRLAVGLRHLAHAPLGFASSSSRKMHLIREAIRGHQRSSEVIRGHQRSSEVIRAHRGRCTAHRGVPPSFASSRPGCETGRWARGRRRRRCRLRTPTHRPSAPWASPAVQCHGPRR